MNKLKTMRSDFCRFCLRADDWNSPLPIFSENFSIPSKVRDVLGIELKENDAFPCVICHLCLAKVTFFNEFHIQVKHSTDLLASILSGRDVVESQEGNSPQQTAPAPVVKRLVPAPQAKVIPQQIADIKLASIEPKDEDQLHFFDYQETLNKKNVERGKWNNNVIKSNSALKRCPKCKFSTKFKAVYDSHVSNSFQCSFCNLYFCTEKGLRVHESHHKRQRISLASNIVGELNNDRNSHIFVNIDHKSKDLDSNSSRKKDNNVGVVKNNVESKYLLCEICKKVYLNEEDYMKHNKEFHSDLEIIDKSETSTVGIDNVSFQSEMKKPQGGKVRKNSSGKVRKNSSSLNKDNGACTIVEENLGKRGQVKELDESDAASVTSEKSFVRSRRKKKDLNESVTAEKSLVSSGRKKDLDKNNHEGVGSKRPKTSEFACWICKGVFEDRQKLFTHPCIQPHDSDSSSKSVTCDRLNSDDEEMVSKGFRKRRRANKVYSEDGSDVGRYHDSEDGIYIIENQATSKYEKDVGKKYSSRKRSFDNDCETHYSVSSSGDEDVWTKSNSRGDNDKRDSSERELDEEGNVTDPLAIDVDLTSFNKDSGVMETPHTNMDSDQTKLSSMKKCNVCSDTFPTMKQLFHHKRLHKILV